MSAMLFSETLHRGWWQTFEVERILFEVRTEHQHLVIFKNPFWGTVMALDGVIQTTERDEFIYHEMMTHVPILAHGEAKKVLIIGGGDGGILREVARHKRIEAITMVEIDGKVVEMCKQYLPNHSAGAFDDPRLNLVIDDGIRFVQSTRETFDVIISDSTDPMGPGEVLFTSPFYKGIKRCLNPGGIFVAQNGVAFMQADEVETTYKRLSPLFADAAFYHSAVPTYVGGSMTFAWASDDPTKRQQPVEVIRERYEASGIDTRYYTPELHVGSFALPKYVQDLMKA
ncbi:spermidine synthase [Sulfurivirga caldicuralii]|uniref:Polyamine aminopropyltransferase n=1 Tax=Sulfurivirga caldicuralii TaxID=364032 RepID=A0A1N6GUW4_9GAMM|nr:polyamine aminopropyltransferase [Sulfurivirga caldicuralii]SIO11237.1 spermidine synthase [Sulfurivirga caldicuralii]